MKDRFIRFFLLYLFAAHQAEALSGYRRQLGRVVSQSRLQKVQEQLLVIDEKARQRFEQTVTFISFVLLPPSVVMSLVQLVITLMGFR